MTQFLLLQAARPLSSFAGIGFESVGIGDGLLSEAATVLFPDKSVPVWKVSPAGHELDVLADDARDTVLAGGALQDTVLGRLLHEAVSKHERFCLFWSEYDDLPVATSELQLFTLLEEQLRSDGSWNWELYALWPGGA